MSKWILFSWLFLISKGLHEVPITFPTLRPPLCINTTIIQNILFYLKKNVFSTFSRTARILLLLVLPGHLLFALTIAFAKAGHTSSTPLFFVFYLVAAVIQIWSVKKRKKTLVPSQSYHQKFTKQLFYILQNCTKENWKFEFYWQTGWPPTPFFGSPPPLICMNLPFKI